MAARLVPWLDAAELARVGQRTDGSVLLVFVDADGRAVLQLEVVEPAVEVDELYLRYVAGLVSDVGLVEVVVLVTRADGRPAHGDRVLWRELPGRLDETTVVLDVVVVGVDRLWSLAAGRGRPVVRVV